MVMEIGGAVGGFESTRWTSTAATPFGPAPGAGRGLGYTSGFHAAPVNPNAIQMDPLLVLGKGPFTVKREPFLAGETPSMVVRFIFTDRGATTQGVLDASVKAFLKNAGFKASKATSFKPESVTWRWQIDPGGTFYYAIVQTPEKWKGMRYAGGAVGSGPVYEPSAALMAKLPTQLWVYTVAFTSGQSTMSDSDGARAITLLKQAMVNMADAKMQSYAHVHVVVRSCPGSLFENGDKPVPVPPVPIPPVPPVPIPPIAKTGLTMLGLLIAYNMISPHIGSESL
jgi:hypothetical protein